MKKLNFLLSLFKPLYLRKAVCLLVISCFFVTMVCHDVIAIAAIPAANIPQYNQIFSDFILPYGYGKITKSHFAGTDRVVINIQDLHCHPQVQKNISNIIEMFDKKYGITNIYLEGAYGNVNTKWLTENIKNDNKKAEILNKILDTGKLTGAEYYSAINNKPEIIKGLEKKEPYLDNLKRFGDLLEKQNQIQLILKGIEESTAKVKKQYYTRRQYKIEELSKKYTSGTISPEKYFKLLNKYTEKLGIDLIKYENTLTYMRLLSLQKELNHKAIKSQLKTLALILKEKLSYDAYRMLLNNTNNFKQPDKLYIYITKFGKDLNLDLNTNFKELNKYFNYIEVSQKINPVDLLTEEEDLVREINIRFSQTIAQREVVFLTHFEKYLKSYLSTKITSDDYQYYKQNIETYKRLYNKYVDNKVFSLLNPYLEETDKFYKINTDRNDYFTENLFNGIKTDKIENIKEEPNEISKIMENMSGVKRIDVIVTGGFHSQTVTDILQQHGVSYIVITPNIQGGVKEAEKTYYQIAKEQKEIDFQTLAAALLSDYPEPIRIKVLIEAGFDKNIIATIFGKSLSEIEKIKNQTNKEIQQKYENELNEKTIEALTKEVKIFKDMESDESYINYEDLKNLVKETASVLNIDLSDKKISKISRQFIDGKKDETSFINKILSIFSNKNDLRNFETISKVIAGYLDSVDNDTELLFKEKNNKKSLKQYIEVVGETWKQEYGNYGDIIDFKILKSKSPIQPIKLTINLKDRNAEPKTKEVVFKCISKQNYDNVRSDIMFNLQIFAQQNNIPVAELIETNTKGKYYIEKTIGKDKYYISVNDFISGNRLNVSNYKEVENFGRKLAQIHNEYEKGMPQKYKNKKEKQWTPEESIDISNDTIDAKIEQLNKIGLNLIKAKQRDRSIAHIAVLWGDKYGSDNANKLIKKLKKSEDENFKMLVKQMMDLKTNWGKIKGKPLKNAFIHADLNYENVFFNDDGELIGIIDWEHSDYSQRAMELARIFAETQEPEMFNVDVIVSFLQGYRDEIDDSLKLDENELIAVFEMTRFFLISRAFEIITNNDNKDKETVFFTNLKNLDDLYEININSENLTVMKDKKETQRIESIIKNFLPKTISDAQFKMILKDYKEGKIDIENIEKLSKEIKMIYEINPFFLYGFLYGYLTPINMKEYRRKEQILSKDNSEKNPEMLLRTEVNTPNNDLKKTKILFNKFYIFYQTLSEQGKNECNKIFKESTSFSVETINANINKKITINENVPEYKREYNEGDILKKYTDEIVDAIVKINKEQTSKEWKNKKDFFKGNKNDYKHPLLQDGPFIMTLYDALDSGFVVGDCTGEMFGAVNRINYRNNRLYLDNFYVIGYFQNGKLIQKYMIHHDDNAMHICSYEDIGGFRPNNTNSGMLYGKEENKGNDGGEFKNIDFEGMYFFEGLKYILNYAKEKEIKEVYLERSHTNSSYLFFVSAEVDFETKTSIYANLFSQEEFEEDQYYTLIEVDYKVKGNNIFIKMDGKKDYVNMDDLINREKASSKLIKIIRTLTGHRYKEDIVAKRNMEKDFAQSLIGETSKDLYGLSVINETITLDNQNLIDNFVENIEMISELLNFPAYALPDNKEGFILQIGQNQFLKVEMEEKEVVNEKNSIKINNKFKPIYETIKEEPIENSEKGKIEEEFNREYWNNIIKGQVEFYNRKAENKLDTNNLKAKPELIRIYEKNRTRYVTISITDNKGNKAYFDCEINENKKKERNLKVTLEKDLKVKGKETDVKEKIQKIKSYGIDIEKELKKELSGKNVIIDVSTLVEKVKQPSVMVACIDTATDCIEKTSNPIKISDVIANKFINERINNKNFVFAYGEIDDDLKNKVAKEEIEVCEIIISPAEKEKGGFIVGLINVDGIDHQIRLKFKDDKVLFYSNTVNLKDIENIDTKIEELTDKYIKEGIKNDNLGKKTVIAFAKKNGQNLTAADVINDIRNKKTDSVTRTLSSIHSFDKAEQITLNNCKGIADSYGITTFSLTKQQYEQNIDTIKKIEEQNFNFITEGTEIIDIIVKENQTECIIDLSEQEYNLEQLQKIRKQFLEKYGLNLTVYIKLNKITLKNLKNNNIFEETGMIPMVDAEILNGEDKIEVNGKNAIYNITDEKQIKNQNDIVCLVFDKKTEEILTKKGVFGEIRNIIENVITNKISPQSKFETGKAKAFSFDKYKLEENIDDKIKKIKALLTVDFTEENAGEKIKEEIDLSLFNLETASYIREQLQKENYIEVLGFIRGVAEKSIVTELSKELNLNETEFNKEINNYKNQLILTSVIAKIIADKATTVKTIKQEEETFEQEKGFDYENTEQFLKAIETNIENETGGIVRAGKIPLTKTDVKGIKALLTDRYGTKTSIGKEFNLSVNAIRSMLSAA